MRREVANISKFGKLLPDEISQARRAVAAIISAPSNMSVLSLKALKRPGSGVISPRWIPDREISRSMRAKGSGMRRLISAASLCASGGMPVPPKSRRDYLPVVVG